MRDLVLIQNTLILRQTDIILRALEGVGEEPILLKGTRFAERFFHHISARLTTDIDILLPRTSASLVEAVLISLGYERVENQRPEHYHVQFVRHSLVLEFELMVEVHYDVVPCDLARIDLERLRADARLIPGFQRAKELSLRDSFYLACIHAANHSLNHLRHRIDVLQLLVRHQERISLLDFEPRATQDKTTRILKVVLSQVYDEFPFLSEMQPLPRAFRRKRQPSSPSNLRFNLSIRDGWFFRLRYLAHWVLPSRGVIAYLIQAAGSERFIVLYYRLCRLRVSQFISMCEWGWLSYKRRIE